MPIRIGANPLCWMNSDIPSLGADIPVDQCVSEVALIGYKGIELEDPLRKALQKMPSILQDRNLELIGGWHSTNLLENDILTEKSRLKEHLDFLQSQGSSLAIIGECSYATHRNPDTGLSKRPVLETDEWQRLCEGLEALAEYVEERGMKTAYHHHMGTVVQSEEDINKLMDKTSKLGLLLDTGHLAYAQANLKSVLEKHINRVTHVHAKNIRFGVLKELLAKDSSFPEAILEGVFTVPGENGYDDTDGLNFLKLVQQLVEMEYDGWLVMEAEQDPAKAHPLTYARIGYQYLHYLLSKALLYKHPTQSVGGGVMRDVEVGSLMTPST
ncbi:MAG: inosose dehydratase [Chlamydiales bacterium]|jgi:inosose dehydratase